MHIKKDLNEVEISMLDLLNFSCVDRALANKTMISLLLLDLLDLILIQPLHECRPHQYVLRLIVLWDHKRAVLTICIKLLDVMINEADNHCLLGSRNNLHHLYDSPLEDSIT